MARQTHDRPSQRRSETSKLSATVYNSRIMAVETRIFLYLTGGSVVLSAAMLSLIGSGNAETVSHFGVAIGLSADLAPLKSAVVVTVFANIELNESGLYASWFLATTIQLKDENGKEA